MNTEIITVPLNMGHTSSNAPSFIIVGGDVTIEFDVSDPGVLYVKDDGTGLPYARLDPDEYRKLTDRVRNNTAKAIIGKIQAVSEQEIQLEI